MECAKKWTDLWTYRFQIYTSHAREQMVNSQKSNDLEMSRSMSNISRTMKITFWAVTLEPEVVEISSWLQNVPYGRAHSVLGLRFWRMMSRFYVTWLNKIYQFWKIFVSSNRQGQTQGQGQIKVKSQGHIICFTILYVIVVIPFIYEKWKSEDCTLFLWIITTKLTMPLTFGLWALTFDLDLLQ